MKKLNKEQIFELAPSAAATQPAGRVSDKYDFVSTTKIIDFLEDAGFYATDAREGVIKKESLMGFGKHCITFRHNDINTSIGGVVPTVVVANAHHGRFSFRMYAGLFRFVCANGLVIGDTTYNMNIRHTHIDEDIFQTMLGDIVDHFPKIEKNVIDMQKVELNDGEKIYMAKEALKSRYPHRDKYPIDHMLLLNPRRPEDESNNLWVTFNRIQENIVRGGLNGIDKKDRKTTTRPIGGVSQTVDFNRKFWDVAAGLLLTKNAKT